MKQISSFQQGLNTAFINRNFPSKLYDRPQFIRNDPLQGQKVIASIEDELLMCESFSFSVAFITMGGIVPLLSTLKELERRGVKGRILTTDYLTFTDPKALEKLNSFSNIEVKMYMTDSTREGFHTKGYIFKNGDSYRIIVGSSNLTLNALTINKEWNTRIVSTEQGEYAFELLDEFEKLWSSYRSITLEQALTSYVDVFTRNQEFAKIVEPKHLQQQELKPNWMQKNFIANLQKIVEANQDRALLISATGTGKTYASAFAMRLLGFKRVLFLVHRYQIAKQAEASFLRVFNNKIKTGLLGGNHQDYDVDYMFGMVQTISKDETLYKLDPQAFECIIIDEAHHSSAASYQKVMRHFKPKLWLGMTATPDKREDSQYDQNIYALFHYNIAYEIRLQHAMEEALLCPFHYFGIHEFISEEKKEKLEHFRYLISDQRVDYIMKQANFFGYSGKRVKGLIFVSRLEEARELSNKFNERGWRTMVLSGASSQNERDEAIERLAQDEGEFCLDYIVTVDLFSEGVDVPEINQVILLRPTQSPIVFIQQLGRGLRKSQGKEYVVVLDFIGNYTNNFMIPIALSGDRTYNKDNLRRYISEGKKVIPGASTIHFDEVAKKQIFKAIDGANFSDIKLIKDNYLTLKNKIGRIPNLKDFDVYGEMDVLRIFDNRTLGSYQKFLIKYDKDYKFRFNSLEEKFLEFISKKFASGKRVQELVVLQLILRNETQLFTTLEKELKYGYHIVLKTQARQNLINIFTNAFASGTGKKTYEDCIFIEENGTDYQVSKRFATLLKNTQFFNCVLELIEFGLSRYHRYYSKSYQDTDFVLYQKYTYEDACRLLNWRTSEVPLNIGGYKYDSYTKTFPVFINYDKEEGVSDTIRYEDHFMDPSRLIAISKNGRTLESEDVQNFIFAKERGIDVQLFVRKNKEDKGSKEFYYLGRMEQVGNNKEFILPNTSKSAVEIEWKLDTAVREDIYDYIVNG